MAYEKRNLGELREARFESQAEAAQAIGVSQATLSRWESGDQEPNSEYRQAYAKALGIDVPELGRIIYSAKVSTSRPSAPERTRRAKR